MKCPNCQHESGATLIKCPDCGECFHRADLERLQNLEFLLNWLNQREQSGDLAHTAFEILWTKAVQQRDLARTDLQSTIVKSKPVTTPPASVPAVRPIEAVSTARAPSEKALPLAASASIVQSPTTLQPVVAQPPAPKPTVGESSKPADLPKTVTAIRPVNELRPVSVPAPTAAPAPSAAPAPKAVSRPVAQPKPVLPPRPSIDWGKVWEKAWGFVLSGALLRGLLYLGAFMIVASAIVLVVWYWDRLAWPLRIGFIAAVPLAFYVGGFFLRNRLKIPVAGGVITGIGAVLVAVDFAAIYQFGGLLFNPYWYWFVASIICSAIYIFTAWRVPGEFFAYLTLMGLASTLVAFSTSLGLPLEWRVAATTGSGVAMLGAAGWLKLHPRRALEDLGAAARRLPQLIIPISLFLIVLIPTLPAVGSRPALGQMTAFVFAALGYGLLAEFFPKTLNAHLAIWSSVVALWFAAQAASFDPAWYATWVVLGAAAYLGLGRLRRRQVIDPKSPRAGYYRAAYVAGQVLLAFGVLAGLYTLAFDLWAGITALVLASIVLAWCAYLFRQPAIAFLAAGLFIVPFSVTLINQLYINHVPQLAAWSGLGWAILALAYLVLAVVLRRAEKYASWLNLWAHILVPVAGVTVLFNFALMLFHRDIWGDGPTLIALTGMLAVYLLSALIHDSGRHPALSSYVAWLAPSTARSIFLWPIGLLVAIWAALAWRNLPNGQQWLGAIWAGLAIVYLSLGQLLAKRSPAYRFPLRMMAYGLLGIGVMIAWNNQLPLMTSLYLAVAALALAAVIYHSDSEAVLAGGLLLAPFYLSLQLLKIPFGAFSLAYALLALLGYLPLGIRLVRAGQRFSAPQFGIGYGIAALALAASLLGRFDVYGFYPKWVDLATPLVVSALMIFSFYYFQRAPFAWVAAAVVPVAYGQALSLLKLAPSYDSAAWAMLGFAYLFLERGLARMVTVGSVIDRLCARSRAFRWPLGLGVILLSGLGLALTARDTVTAFTGQTIPDFAAPLVTQGLILTLVIVAARLYRSRWPLYLTAPLAFLAVTLFFCGCDATLWNQALTVWQFGLIWSLLGLLHLLWAVLLDRSQVRYSHGLYLGGYALMGLAILWTLNTRAELLGTLGLGIGAALGSAVLVHFNAHKTWAEVVDALLGHETSPARSVVRDSFLWVAAWAFPAWCAILLWTLDAANYFIWLGLVVPPLLLLALSLWLRRLERSYVWPLNSAAHFYTALVLTLSAPVPLRLLSGQRFDVDWVASPAVISVGILSIIFYAASAWVFRRRSLTYLAACLTFVPFTLAWIRYAALTPVGFALPWLGLAASLLATGFLLDQIEPVHGAASVRYAHAPYLVGYCLTVFALVWSISDRIVNLYALAAILVLALLSQLEAYCGWHRTFEDLLHFIWRGPAPAGALQRGAQDVFLFFAAYAFPVWLAQLMAHFNVPLAWRGLGLALVAPLYVALGLGVRRVRCEYTWPLYTAGYALTAIGAMLSFESEMLAIYVLALDALVYGVSAYIFRQSFWLYLANSLAPVITLLILHYNGQLTAPWVAGVFMSLAFVYFIVGRWFDNPPVLRRSALQDPHRVGPAALAFLAPAYLLSAVALAVATGSELLAIEVFGAGVVFYALSAWVFRESLFLYPAVWLGAVPYYLLMPRLGLPREWQGLGWLPLILLSLGLGKFVFHRQPLGSLRQPLLRLWGAGVSAPASPPASLVTHPALPFYILAYGLSLSLLLLSQSSATVLTTALAVAAGLYFGSAALFRRAAWLYPALLSAHAGFLTYFAIQPSNAPPQYISLPFLGFTWLVAWIGYAFSRRLPLASGPVVRLGQFEFGNWSFARPLIQPSWAQPFVIFATLDVFVWQTVALGNPNTAIIVATGFMVLAMLLASLWQDLPLVYGTLLLFMIAIGYRLGSAGLATPDSFAILGGIGFGLYLAARLAERSRTPLLRIWPRPLTQAAISLNGLAVVVTLPFSLTHQFATAAALAFAGALYLTVAYRGHYYRLGYSAIAMLELAWALILYYGAIGEPELFAIPAGLYLTGVGYLERHRSRRLFAVTIETFGLAVLLMTAFIQSLNSGQAGLPHFVILLVASLLVIWWGASRRLKVPFFIGLGASVLNVAGQIVMLFGGGDLVLRFAIIGAAGLVIVAAAVVVERQRSRIVVKAKEWREALETWE